MASAAILRKSAPSLARLARVNRSNHSAIFITSSHLSSTSFVPIFRFSSAVETKKKPSYDEWGKVILSEQDFDLGEQPKDDDHYFWEKLKRKFAYRCHATLPLVVTVTKNSGTSLKFSCTGYPDSGYPNTLSIHGLSVRKSETSKDEMPYGLDFYYLEENFVKVFLRYLEIRGIEPATNNLLFELMINKDSSEYLLWLKNVKNFIEA
ncbi:hypothetical protein LWI28_002212 [Acer negundo]|uniref:Mitochondrial glycoprotein n=1 Tax=Acer negundo TaxID=4023 RepID=A0AAD5P3P9_ACENE|nr:hypothetical protein LWI28_002212 [Acer negundo]